MPLILHVVTVTPQSVIWMANDGHMPLTDRNRPITRSHWTDSVATTRMRSARCGVCHRDIFITRPGPPPRRALRGAARPPIRSRSSSAADHWAPLHSLDPA
jgi:hypothetical protein